MKNNEELWYLATPYWDDNSAVREARFKKVNEIAWKLAGEGIFTFSPVSMSHPIHEAVYTNEQLDREQQHWFFMHWDRLFFDKCVGIILCDGYLDSRGCMEELAWFTERGKPVRHVRDLLDETS